MRFTEKLLKESMPIWEKYLEHPFIKEIGEGTLDKNKFKEYLVQDYLYLKESLNLGLMSMLLMDLISLQMSG